MDSRGGTDAGTRSRVAPPLVSADFEVTVHLVVNGTEVEERVDARTTLLDVRRERLGLTGAKKGCDHGQCGSCTVVVDGRRMNSCLAERSRVLEIADVMRDHGAVLPGQAEGALQLTAARQDGPGRRHRESHRSRHVAAGPSHEHG